MIEIVVADGAHDGRPVDVNGCHSGVDRFDLVEGAYETGLQKYIDETGDDKGQLYVSLETAHPAKFPEEITKLLGFDPDLPKSLEGIEEKEEQYDTIEKDYESFKKYLMDNY